MTTSCPDPFHPNWDDSRTSKGWRCTATSCPVPFRPSWDNSTIWNNCTSSDNQLTGLIPDTFSGLSDVTHFFFQENDGLCLPSTPALLDWVDGLDDWNGSRCDEAGFAEGLLMVGKGADRLYKLNPNTGEAKPVGEAVRFGVDEYEPYGLAAHHGTLYMTGGWNSALYSLDPETGVASRVGDAVEFGVGESQPFGLASHNGTLYLSGGTNSRLYTLDTVTGEATPVGDAVEFGIGESQPFGLASHEGDLFMVGYNSARLYVLNPATGTATPVGDAVEFGVGEDLPTGLTSHRGVLYMAGGWTAKLYTLDATTGIASPVGNVDEDVNQFGVDEDASDRAGFADARSIAAENGSTGIESVQRVRTSLGIAH